MLVGSAPTPLRVHWHRTHAPTDLITPPHPPDNRQGEVMLHPGYGDVEGGKAPAVEDREVGVVVWQGTGFRGT